MASIYQKAALERWPNKPILGNGRFAIVLANRVELRPLYDDAQWLIRMNDGVGRIVDLEPAHRDLGWDD